MSDIQLSEDFPLSLMKALRKGFTWDELHDADGPLNAIEEYALATVEAYIAKQSLAPPAQEPVATVVNKYGDLEDFDERVLEWDDCVLQKLPYGTNLYAHPPAQVSIPKDMVCVSKNKLLHLYACISGVMKGDDEAWKYIRNNVETVKEWLTNSPESLSAAPDSEKGWS